MRITRSILILSILPALLTITGCPPKQEPPPPPPPTDFNKPLGPGEKALRKARPEEIPDFAGAYNQRTNLETAARYNLEYLSRKSSTTFFPYLDITHDRAVQSNEAFIEVLRSARSPEEFDRMIKDRFEVYISRGADDSTRVLFTGYYRPIFDARLKPDAQFRYPLYKKPKELVGDPIYGKYTGPNGAPYYTRADIDRGALAGKGLELVYLRDRFEAYIVTVQGSGKLRMADGSFFEIGYAGDNGHDYKSIGQSLVDSNAIPASQLSLQGLIRYFREHPEKLDSTLAINPRYVFFTPRTGGPYGSLNVPVTPFRSIATDKQVYPRACVAYMETQLPWRAGDGQIVNRTYHSFEMDQDTGGAIRAAGRCDVFMGTGPEVGELAGRTLSEGKLFYIFVKQGAGYTPAAAPPGEMAPPPNGDLPPEPAPMQ